MYEELVMTENEKKFLEYQTKIEQAQQNNLPINNYVLQQIKLLEKSHEEFLEKAVEKGYDLSLPRIGEIEIGQILSMKQLAEKINLPTEKYDNMVRDVRIRIFGEKGYKQFFEN